MVIKANKQRHVLLSDVLLTPTVVTHCSRTQKESAAVGLKLTGVSKT